MFFFVILLNLLNILKVCYGGFSRKPACLEEFRGAFRIEQPFSKFPENPNVTGIKGIIPKVFMNAMATCCRGDVETTYKRFLTQDQVLDMVKNYSLHFILPIQRNVKSNKFLSYPFVPVVQSPGLAFYVVKKPSTGEVIVEAITSTWPLIAMLITMVTLAGCCFCIIEMVSLSLSGKEYQPFRLAIWEGIWWSFVSMTTVGYGDVCPKTKPGRIFSIVWVITGVACCALFTSFITTVLTSACMMQKVSLAATKVGVLTGSEGHRFAMKKNSMPEAFSTIDEVIEALKHEQVKGILIDSYVAAEHKDKLEEFNNQMVIEHISSYGIVFLNEGLRFSSCVRDYVFSRQNEISDIIRNSVTLLEVSDQSQAEKRSKNLFNAEAASFYMPVISILATLVFIILLGVAWDINEKKRKAKGNKFGFNEEISLTEWRSRYKNELHKALQQMHVQCSTLRHQCSNLMEQLSNSNGIVSLHKKTYLMTPLLDGEVRSWTTRE